MATGMTAAQIQSQIDALRAEIDTHVAGEPLIKSYRIGNKSVTLHSVLEIVKAIQELQAMLPSHEMAALDHEVNIVGDDHTTHVGQTPLIGNE